MSTHQTNAAAVEATAGAETEAIRVAVELPGELRELIGSPEALAERARRSLILDLLREGEISQGKAAHLLGITRYDILDLMARYEIPSGPLTAEEMRQDIENARCGSVLARLHGGD